MDTLKALSVFMDTVERGSFSDTARELGVSPAAISQCIARLESELEVRLFYRTTRQLTLTEEGKRFYEQCRFPVKHLDAAIQQIRISQETPAGLITVSVPPCFAHTFLMPFMADFQHQYPEIQIAFSYDPKFGFSDSDSSDLGLVWGEHPNNDYISKELKSVPYVLVATPEYWENHAKPRNPTELEFLDCIVYSPANKLDSHKWYFTDKDTKQNFSLDINARYSSHYLAGTIDLVKANLGVAQVPEYEVRGDLYAGRLVSVLDNYAYLRHAMYMSCSQDAHLSPAVHAFMTFFSERLA